MSPRLRTTAIAPAVGRTRRATQPLARGAILVTVLTWGVSNVVITAVSAAPLAPSSNHTGRARRGGLLDTVGLESL